MYIRICVSIKYGWVHSYIFLHSLGTSEREVTETGAVGAATSATYGRNNATSGPFPNGEHTLYYYTSNLTSKVNLQVFHNFYWKRESCCNII